MCACVYVCVCVCACACVCLCIQVVLKTKDPGYVSDSTNGPWALTQSCVVDQIDDPTYGYIVDPTEDL